MPDDITEEQLRAHGLEVELRQAQARIRHLEQAPRAAGRVLAPYAGNGTGRYCGFQNESLTQISAMAVCRSRPWWRLDRRIAAMLTTLTFVALADLACWWAQWANNQERKHRSRGWDEDLVRQSIVCARALILGVTLVMLGLIARTS